MDDAAVMASLMSRQFGFLFKNRNPEVGIAVGKVHGRGQADDAPTHDGDVVLLPFHDRAPVRLLHLFPVSPTRG